MIIDPNPHYGGFGLFRHVDNIELKLLAVGTEIICLNPQTPHGN